MNRLLAGILALALAGAAHAATVILSSTTYQGVVNPNAAGGALTNPLPAAGVYTFTLKSVVVSGTPVINVYLQQVGISGALYTIFNSTFSTCTNACNFTVAPDVYLGGYIQPQWTVVGGSATITVSANQVTP